MKSVIVGISLLFLSIAPASATGFHFPCFFFCGPPVVPPSVAPKPAAAVPDGGSGKTLICPTPAGVFICIVAAGIIIHEVMGPACADSSPRNVKYGWDTPTFWRPLCNTRIAGISK